MRREISPNPCPSPPASTHPILYEVIADCYDEEEQLMGWYYYMSDNLSFPIDVAVRFALRGGKTEMKPAQIVDLDPKSEQGSSIRLGISETDSQRVQYISPADIISMDTTPENAEIINDWLYWHNHKML